MLKKILKRTLLVVLLAFIVIQFFRPTKNKATGPFANDIANRYPVPEDVKTILKASCNDCHSNNTVYPWYAEVQPVAWWLDGHIKDGKSGLNFDEFLSYPIRKQYKRLDDIKELVKKDEMPLKSFLWIHKYAKLSESQKLIINNWANSLRDSIKTNYPPDSLIRKK